MEERHTQCGGRWFDPSHSLSYMDPVDASTLRRLENVL